MRRQTTLPAWLRLTGQGRSVDRYEDSGCSQCALENPYERLLAVSIPPQPFRSYVASGKFFIGSEGVGQKERGVPGGLPLVI